MSILSTLAPAEGSRHYRKRIGRGRGSGMGQTSAKGHKGQIQRSGGRVRRGFEGGQTPLSRRLPKYGFNNHDFATEYDIVNLAQLDKASGTVGPDELKKLGLVRGTEGLLIKILGFGEIKKALTIRAHKFSAKAKEAIEKAGGKVEVIEPKTKTWVRK